LDQFSVVLRMEAWARKQRWHVHPKARTEAVARELLEIRGWNLSRPPKGNVLWKNEYRDYPHLLEAMLGRGKLGQGGDAYPDFLVVTPEAHPLIVGETKASESKVDLAISEACDFYGEAFADKGIRVLAAGIAGDDKSNIEVRVKKRSMREWRQIEYREKPIQWLPTPEENQRYYLATSIGTTFSRAFHPVKYWPPSAATNKQDITRVQD